MSAQIHHNCHDILAPKSRPITAAMLNSKKRKRMGSGDPSGLQNRRELASLALVSSTLTRFRQFSIFRGFEAKPGSWRDYDAIQVRQSFTSFIGPPGYRTEGMPIAAAAPHQKSQWLPTAKVLRRELRDNSVFGGQHLFRNSNSAAFPSCKSSVRKFRRHDVHSQFSVCSFDGHRIGRGTNVIQSSLPGPY